MTESLEQRVRANPDDVEAWLILGDQLQEAGDPIGELIALAHQPASSSQRQEELRGQVVGPRAAFFMGCDSMTIEWRHGVPHRACLTGEESLIDVLGALPAARFLRELQLSDLAAGVSEALDAGLFDSLVRLDFEAFDTGDDSPKKLGTSGVRALAGCRRLAQLESLNLGGQQIGDEGMLTVARANLSRLRALSLNSNDLGERGIEALATCESLANLRELSLFNNWFGDAGIAHLAESCHLKRITSLRLGVNKISKDATSLIRSSNLSFVETLAFAWDNVGNAILEALESSPHAERLSSLNMLECGIDHTGIRHLASSALLPQLRKLGLCANRIDDDAVITLAASLPAHLRELDLESNPLGDEGMIALAECPRLQHLEHLWLWGDAKRTRGIDALLGSKYLSEKVKKSLAWQFDRGPQP